MELYLEMGLGKPNYLQMLMHINLDFGWALSPMIGTSFFLYIYEMQLDVFVSVPDVEKIR